jgi:hypothetical protein
MGVKIGSVVLAEEHWMGVLKNKVFLMKKFSRKGEDVTREWRSQNSEELVDLYWPQNIIWVIKSRRMRPSGRVTRMGKRKGT